MRNDDNKVMNPPIREKPAIQKAILNAMFNDDPIEVNRAQKECVKFMQKFAPKINSNLEYDKIIYKQFLDEYKFSCQLNKSNNKIEEMKKKLEELKRT